MAKDEKFGTFGGVFTPSILTILGVIMYLRLPWVVGEGGLYTALGIIAVAHIISVSTGLSISSIATDKKVGAGGPYYIISRSLGLPIGGTLGLALFIGLAFSVSLYIIGFSESFLGFLHVARTPNAIRICGTVTIILLTIITFVSTALAIKTQYLILALIGLSLVSIFFGPHQAAVVGPHLTPSAGSKPVAELFGVFFPAVTGFTAGVNMSGDLRDPKRAIPRGTLAAIAAGLVVYAGLAIFLALRVPPKQLIDDPDVLLHTALSSPFVMAGIWGATLSSALGSILGAPRILQALSVDRITPRVFARGYGSTNEPRNALLLAFVIAEGGILIAELDAIARIVSMVFLAMYGFLNICSAIESWASPDFRPAFRIPRGISVVGAVTCVLVMIQLDIVALAGSVVLMAGLFFYLERKQLVLEAGDAWEGIWASLIRSGLHRLRRETKQQRNWRPNVLAFHEAGDAQHERQLRVTAALIAESGIASDFELVEAGQRSRGAWVPSGRGEEPQLGLFSHVLPAPEPYDAVEHVCRYHGFAALEPNTLLVPWSLSRREPQRFAALLDSVSEMGLSLLVYAPTEREVPRKRRIDVWWRDGAGNLAFCMALMRFVTRARGYERAAVRLVLASADSADNDHLRTSARRLLSETRVDATIRIVDLSGAARPFADRVREESMDAELVVLGLPNDPAESALAFDDAADALVEELADVLLVRASPDFKDVITLGRTAAVSFLPPSGEGQERELPEIAVPEAPDLARAVTAFAEAEQARVTQLFEHCVQGVYSRHIALLRRIEELAARHLAPLERVVETPNPRKLRHAINRARSTFLIGARETLEAFDSEQIDEQSTMLAARVEGFIAGMRADADDELVVERPRADFEPHPDDSPWVRRFKRRRRTIAWLSRRPIRYRVPIGKLSRFYADKALREILRVSTARIERDTHQLVIHLGKVLASAGIAGVDGDEATLAAAVVEHEKQLRGHLAELVITAKEHVALQQWNLLVGARKLADELAHDIVRLDVASLVDHERKVTRESEALRTELGEMPERWADHQRRLVGRAVLGLALATFQQRIATIAAREKQATLLDLKNGVLHDCGELHAALVALRDKLAAQENGHLPHLEVHPDLKSRFEPKPVIDTLVREMTDPLAELPESVETLTDESIQRLEEGSKEPVEVTELPVRRLAQFLVDSELLGGVEDKLSELPAIEQRAASVGQDVLRLVAFQIAEAEAPDAALVGDALVAVVDSGIERLGAELERLRAALPAFATVVDQGVRAVLEGTSAWDLASRAAHLEQHIRLRQGRIAVSGVRGLVRRGIVAARRTAVDLVYGRSAGVLLARRLAAGAAPGGAVVDRVRAFARSNTPRRDVLDALPFYYRQLFVGQSAISDAFWVARDAELAKARRAFAGPQGASGVLLVTGRRGAGKTALCQRITSELSDRRTVFRVSPRIGGSIDPAAFDASLQQATDRRGSARQIISELPDGATIVIDDLELWWERSEDGLAVIDHITELVERSGRRCRFVLALASSTLAFVDRFRSLSDRAIALIECPSMSAMDLKKVVTLRHGSSGLKFELGAQAESELGELGLARLFSDHFDYSGGIVGAALRSWVTHVDKVRGEVIAVRAPEHARREVLDELRTEHVALLAQLMLHKQLTHARLGRVSGVDPRGLAREIETLERMNLVVPTRHNVLELNPFVQHIVAERLVDRGLLS